MSFKELFKKTSDQEQELDEKLGAALSGWTSSEATVVKTISPKKTGTVRFQGSWWSAKSTKSITLHPGEIVRVVGRENINLLVEPIASASSSSLSEETLILEDLDKMASGLDDGDARIRNHQAVIDKLQEETSRSLSDLAELVEKL